MVSIYTQSASAKSNSLLKFRFNNKFFSQAKNSELTVIHEMIVEADTTGYVDPPIDEEPEDEKNMEESIPGNGLQLPDAIERAGRPINVNRHSKFKPKQITVCFLSHIKYNLFYSL